MHPLILTLIIIGSALVFLLAVYLILIAPSAPRRAKKYKNVKFAHRGLHGEGVAENSMSAFKAAVDNGYGIELDVRLSADGQLVVFHDDTLARVVGAEGRVDAYTAEELGKMTLSGTADTVPLFSDVLKLVSGKVPLLVEIKEDPGVSEVSKKTCEILSGYDGDFLIESFNPLSLRNVVKHLPRTPRGILSHRYYAYEAYRKPLYFLLQCLLFNRICRPSFVAYDIHHAKSISLRIARAMGAVTFAWTVRSKEEEALAKKHGFDGVIFENYLPEK